MNRTVKTIVVVFLMLAPFWITMGIIAYHGFDLSIGMIILFFVGVLFSVLVFIGVSLLEND